MDRVELVRTKTILSDGSSITKITLPPSGILITTGDDPRIIVRFANGEQFDVQKHVAAQEKHIERLYVIVAVLAVTTVSLLVAGLCVLENLKG